MARTARDLMQTSVVTVAPSDTLASARRLFVDEDIHGAPVVDEQGRVLGMVSSTDLLRAAAEAHDSERPEIGYFHEGDERHLAELENLFVQRLGDARVSDVMTQGVVDVSTKASVAEVAHALCENRVHRVLVMDDGSVKGIISAFDLIALLEKPEG